MTADQTSKQLVRSLFQLEELPRMPFIPWISSFAAKLEQISVRDMLSDSSRLFRAYSNAQKLFGYDGITVASDPTLEAEACGCRVKWGEFGELPTVISHPLAEGASPGDLNAAGIERKGRIPVVCEAIKRLSIVRGKDTALLARITGPLALAGHLYGDKFFADLQQNPDKVSVAIETAGKVGQKLCRTYCELGLDGIVVADDLSSIESPAQFEPVVPVLRTIWNVAKYYNVHTMLLTRHYSISSMEPVFELGADAVVVSSQVSGDMSRVASKYGRCFGRALSSRTLVGEKAAIQEIGPSLRASTYKGMFLTTEWDVPYETPISNMHEIMRIVRGEPCQ